MKTQIRLTKKLQLLCSSVERNALHSLSLASKDDILNMKLYQSINQLLKLLNKDPDYQGLDHFIRTKYEDLFDEISNDP
ncbi:hypothetical protein [Eel River basin pequenovirus]|nr:hypothetical protein [Eel River basin pequenovirus]